MVNVVGHKEVLETTLQDWIDGIDNADRSGPSHHTDFSQSRGNSTNNTDATTRMYAYPVRARPYNYCIGQQKQHPHQQLGGHRRVTKYNDHSKLNSARTICSSIKQCA
jgi:hypothetical protein